MDGKSITDQERRARAALISFFVFVLLSGFKYDNPLRWSKSKLKDKEEEKLFMSRDDGRKILMMLRMEEMEKSF
jgi:hypothetical protein